MWTRVLVSLAVSARIPTRSWLLASRVRSWGRSAPVWALRSCFLSLSSHCFSFVRLSVDFTSLMPLHSHLFLMPTIIPAPSPTFYIYQQLLQCCGNDFLNTGKKHEAGCSSWKGLTGLSRKKGTIQHKAFAAPSLFPQPDICLKLSHVIVQRTGFCYGIYQNTQPVGVGWYHLSERCFCWVCSVCILKLGLKAPEPSALLPAHWLGSGTRRACSVLQEILGRAWWSQRFRPEALRL